MNIVEYNEVPPVVENIKGRWCVNITCPEQGKEDPNNTLLFVGVRVYQKVLDYPPDDLDSTLASMQRDVRDKLIEKYEWRIQRYQQQRELGVTEDSEQWWENTLNYVQQLRDITQQKGFPSVVEWPINPDEMEN